MSNKNIGIAVGVGVVVVIAAGLALPLSNLPTREVDAEVLAKATDPALAQVLPLYKNKCMDCHSSYGELPLYASFPIASGMIAGHQAAAMRHWDMDAEWLDAEQPTQASLAKVQQVFDDRSMPPSEYTMLHWNAGISDADVQANLGWLRHARAAANGWADASDPVLNRAVLPIVPVEGQDPAEVALGDALYHDVRLSSDDTISCASCHDLAKGGTDQLPTSIGIDGQVGPINSPTTYNAVYALAQFWDGRSPDLVDQAGGPVENPVEMGAAFDEVLAKFDQDPQLVAQFVAVFGPDQPEPAEGEEEAPAGEDEEYVRPPELTQANIQRAIATFEETLTTPNSTFDKWLRGEAEAMGPEAVAGWELFDALGCDTCHAGQALGGTSFEKMGTEADYFVLRGGDVTVVDAGRFNHTKDESDRHHFKVPTLRNLAKTFPYFHDGSVTEMAEAARIMAKVQKDRSLTDAEAASMVAFFEALTGEYQGEPIP